MSYETESADTSEIEELDYTECLKLVGSMSIGRVAVAVEDLTPLVVPVNYVLDGETVVFRSSAGSKLEALRWRKPLSFQVDLIDPFHRTGWSVLIRGVAQEATNDEMKHLFVDTWAPGDKHHWIRVLPTAITGRRILLPDAPWDARSYL